MKVLKKPYINAIVIAVVSAFYALIFILISGHVEFERLLNRTVTLNSTFWNGWSAFLKQGSIKYIGYVYLLLAIIIVLLSFVKKRDYDEYQKSILEKGILTMGVIMIMTFPISLIMVLSDPSYCVETLMFLVVLHWTIVLIMDLIYVIKYNR